VVTEEEYAKWVGEQKKAMSAKADDPNKTWTVAELSARGEQVYAANCVACHQANGKGVPGAFPALDGSQMVNGPQDSQIDILLNGKNAMPPWKGSLSDTEIAAVITYTRNHWSNKAADNIVQPAEVLAARK
jgi:cytochrome c oxidase subunit 2